MLVTELAEEGVGENDLKGEAQGMAVKVGLFLFKNMPRFPPCD
jgi:hypothetical protein